MSLSIVVIGGGAAGFFASIRVAELNPSAQVTLLERSKRVLDKVRISGGGRCNLTHACFEPKELVKHYPRGSKELLGPFHKFACGDTIGWFDDRGVATKIEEDGRMFPISDSSQSVMDCLEKSAAKAGVIIKKSEGVDTIYAPNPSHPKWGVKTKVQTYAADRVMIASGSNHRMWKLLEQLGHRIIEPVPSLFTFNIKDPRLKDLMGLSVPKADLRISGTKLQASGPLLITHWGLSGPAILRLSAWGARDLAERQYRFELRVNWINEHMDDIIHHLQESKQERARQKVFAHPLYTLPQRLWKSLLTYAQIPSDQTWANLSKKALHRLAEELGNGKFQVNGKSTFKEEFVTAGGVDLKEVDFRSFESKLLPGLFFAGEVLNIDAITGGFNFQAAWTGAWIAGGVMAEEED